MTLNDTQQEYVRNILFGTPISDLLALAYGVVIGLEWADEEFSELPAPLTEFIDRVEKAGQSYLDSLV